MGADALLDSSTLGRLLDYGKDHHSRQALATVVEKEYIFALTFLAARLQVELNPVAGNATDGYESLLVARADDADITLAEE